jgi:Zn-dependent protease with chaperone function
VGDGQPARQCIAKPIWICLAAATLTACLVATILSLALPVVETGSDPMRIPIAAIVSPVAAAALTVLAGIIAGAFSRSPEAD